jgi:flagellar basal-body rod protein FlgC
MSSIMSIGLSGMRAAQAQVTAAASNIANAGSVGRIPSDDVPVVDEVYQPIDVIQFDTGAAGQPGGVGYNFVVRPDAFTIEHDPNSPVANENGDVARPAVDITSELVSLAAAKYQFYASAKVVQVGEQMMRAAINMIA